MSNLKLAMEKYELLKAMNLIIICMNDQDAYCRWILIVPDQATEEDLMEIAADEDETIFKEACRDFRRICKDHIDAGFFVGCWPNTGFYGAKREEEYEEEDEYDEEEE